MVINSPKIKMRSIEDRAEKDARKMRSIEKRDEKDRQYQDEMVRDYIRRYVSLSRHMATDYKKHAINAYITETYC